MIVVDASVLIAHLDGRDALHDRAEGLLLDVADQTMACSPITMAEVLVGPARAERLDAARRALGDLELETIELAADAPARLALLRAGTGLRLPDCCVILAAQDSSATALLTFDKTLAREAERLGFRVR